MVAIIKRQAWGVAPVGALVFQDSVGWADPGIFRHVQPDVQVGLELLKNRLKEYKWSVNILPR